MLRLALEVVILGQLRSLQLRLGLALPVMLGLALLPILLLPMH